MEIVLNSKNVNTHLNKKIFLPFSRGDKLFFNCNNLSFEIDLFNTNNNGSNYELLSMRFPNKKNIPLEDIRKVADLFPFLNEKFYKKTKITTFETELMNETIIPIVAIVDCNSNFYGVCFALFGGEYSRNPGTNIMLLDIKKIENNRINIKIG
jgi:hypothetical protein